MRKGFMKLAALGFVGALALSMTACQSKTGTNTSATAKPKESTIAVALYADSGPGPEAAKAYLDSLSDTLNVEFTYAVLSMTDESANITKVQELIASGADGIICTMDLGTEAILQECEAAGVYLAGYLCDYEMSYNANYDNVFLHDYFLGTVSDGPCGDDLNVGYVAFDVLMEYNETHPDAPIQHISLATWPSWAYPGQLIYVQQLTESIEEFNQTAEKPITIDPLNEETDVLQFTNLDSTYFTKHEGIDAIVSFAAGDFLYPTMVSSGVDTTIKLFAVGYDGVEGANFGSSGTGTYQMETQSAVEALNYPLVLLLNKLNGKEFADMPENAERVSSSIYVINSDEDMEAFKGSLYVTGKAEDAQYTAADVLNMTAFGNPNATYKDLVDMLSHMTIDDIK
jgi:ABC-type sugar transport system substrate-binding protein